MWKKLSGMFCVICVSTTLGFNTSAYAQESSLNLEDCHVDGFKEKVKCGTLAVPENYQQPQGTHIDLNVTILPAIDNSGNKIPLMFLAGGPGQAATELASVIRYRFYELRKTRDIILVDQRGTGASSQLECDVESLQNLDVYGTLSLDFDMSEIHDCVSQFSQDTTQFNSENAIRDVDAVRVALGYQKINIYGGSYGTRAALIYMQMFPDSLNSVVLDSVAPMDIRIGVFGKTAADSFQTLMDNCNAEDTCKSAFPNLDADFQKVYAQLDEAPIEMTIPHPRLATPTTLIIDKQKFVSTIQTQLYSTSSRSILPLLINQAANGNFMPFVGVLAQSDELQPRGSVYINVLLNIACSEDFPMISDSTWAEDANNTFAREISHTVLRMVCPVWPKYSPSEFLYEPVTANIPTLILSGKLDPVTPPQFGDIADKMLPNSRHLIADKVGHIVASNECGVDIVAQFIDDLDLAAIDDSCLEELPAESFMTSLNGNM